MQGSPPDSVHSACSLGLQMLPSTFLSDDFPHICDRLKMAANPLIERRSLYPFTLNLVWLCDYLTDRLWWSQASETGSFHFLSLGMQALEETSCHVIGLAPLRLPCLWEAHALWRGHLWRGHQGWDVMWRKGEAKGHWGTRETSEGALCSGCSALAVSTNTHGSEMNHSPELFLNSWPAKSWAK